jgi:hypothetical protein
MNAASPDRVVNAALAEFTALRSEMDNANSSQQTIVNINITAAGLIFSFVLAKKADPLLLLVAAAISSALGMYIQGSWYHVRRIARYIDTTLRPLMIEYTGESKVFGWEQAVQARQGWWVRLVPVGLATAVLFSLIPLVVLIWVIPYLKNSTDWLAWSIAVLLFLMQLCTGGWLALQIVRSKRWT